MFTKKTYRAVEGIEKFRIQYQKRIFGIPVSFWKYMWKYKDDPKYEFPLDQAKNYIRNKGQKKFKIILTK